MEIGAADYAYTASDLTENIELCEFSLLNIIPGSLRKLAKGNALCRFIEKGSRVPFTISKDMWLSLPQQKTCHFSIREDESIDMGTANIEIAEFLLIKALFCPVQK